MAGPVVEFSQSNFEQEVTKSSVPVLVDLWAAWCVDPQSHISVGWRNSYPAKSIHAGHPVLSLGGKSLVVGRVARALVSTSLGHCLAVQTETGRQLRVTDEHRFLTRKGWKSASQLNAGMDVAIYPVLEATNGRLSSSSWVLTAQQVEHVSLPRIKLSVHLDDLKKKGLIPLRINQPSLPIIARLMGALFSDGGLYHQDSNNAREVSSVVGRHEDALQVRGDLASLGFSSQVQERITHQQIGHRSFSTHTYRVKCCSTSAWLFFKALGVPEGNKTNTSYLVPAWLMRAPPLIQREFLAGYLGGDGPTPMIRLMARPKKQPCDHLSVNDVEFHKRVDLAMSGLRFAQQLATLLGQFGVQVRRAHIEEGVLRKDGSRTAIVHLPLSATYESVYALCHRIGYAYATSKLAEAQKIGEFVRKKLSERDTWQQRYSLAQRLYKRGGPVHVVAKQPKLPYNTVRDWLRRGVSATIQQHHERYALWVQRVSMGSRSGQLWERVVSVKPTYLPKVSRLSVTPKHNFIANGFVVHNCGPCRMIAPVVEELAGKYQGKMKMGKLNVDDHPQVAAQFRIMNIPTLLFFKNGKEVDRIVGVVPKEELTRRIEHVIS